MNKLLGILGLLIATSVSGQQNPLIVDSVLQAWPVRVVPDTRTMKTFNWFSGVLNKMDKLWDESVALRLESALCLYGRFNAEEGSLSIMEAEAPLLYIERDSVHAMFDCRNSPWYLGNAHTHVTGEEVALPSLIDIHGLLRGDLAIVKVVIYGRGKYTLVNREIMWWYFDRNQ